MQKFNRKLFVLIVSLFFILTLPALSVAFQVDVLTVCFSPDGGCAKAITDQINKAQKSIKVMAYSFTSAPIANALLDAKKRGVNVEVIIDKSRDTERYSETRFFRNQGIPVYVDGKEAIQHNKVMIIDSEIVITGSFNFTKAAEEKNAENVLIIMSKELVKSYLENWYEHKEHSSQ